MERQKKLGRPRRVGGDEQTADRILQCAAQLFMEHGYNGVSMEQVAEAVGLTKAMVYYYFDSKASLLTSAMVRVMENVRARTRLLLSQDAPLYTRLLEVTRAHLRRAPLDFEGIMRRAQTALSETQLEAMQRAEEQLFETIAEAFQEAMAKGEVRQTNARFCARAYMALLMAGRLERRREKATDGQVPQPAHADERDTLQAGEGEEIRRMHTIAEALMEVLWLGVGSGGIPDKRQ